MNKYEVHPQIEELLLYVDGELPRRSRAAIRKHLEPCWKCRAELAALESVISEFILDRAEQETAESPVSRCSPEELRRKLEVMDREMELPGLGARIRRWFGLMPRVVRLPVSILALAGAAFGLAVAYHFASPVLVRHREPAADRPAAPRRALAPPVPTPVPMPAKAPKTARAENEAVLGASAEVAAWSRLHELGADLGEPLEVVGAPNGSVTVIFRQMDRARESEIRAALAGVAGITVRTEEARQEDAKSRALLPSQAGTNAAEPVLVAAFGGRAAFDRLVNEVLEGEDALLSRAQAIRVIEDHFPLARMAGLDAADRGEIERMAADHRRAARESAQRIAGTVAQAASALGGAHPDRVSARAGLLTAAQRMDHIVSIVFGGSPSDAPARQLGSELAAAMAQLTASLETLP